MKARIALTVFLATFAFLPCRADFGAYYTKVHSGEAFEQFSRTGPHADIVIRDLGAASGRLVFWRGSSYLPYWEVNGKKWFLEELTERSGDGPPERPDRVNTYSFVRIIENTPTRAVIHWRYLPRFEGANPHYNATNVGGHQVTHLVEPSAFVDEYFVVCPDGKVARGFREGKQKYQEWVDPENVSARLLELTATGVTRSAGPALEAELRTVMGVSARPSPETVAGNPLQTGSVATPVKCWRFDEGAGDVALEEQDGSACAVEGDRAYWKKGVSGTALAFDGYNSVVRLPAGRAPPVAESVTLEAWVAIGAYPWNWTPVIQQGHEESWYLGVGPHGRVRMCVNLGNQVERVDSHVPLSRRRWYHLAGTYDRYSGLLRVFVDGELSGEAKTAGGSVSVSHEPIQIGQGRAMQPSDPVRASTYEHLFSFDGLIDEVRLYDQALSPAEIAESHALYDPGAAICEHPDLDARVLPAGLNTGAFGAYYTHLRFYDTWDGLFRFGAHPDVVVELDQHPTRFVFWRGTCFIPMIVNERGAWYSNEFNETWTRSGGEGCMEPMSDKESFSNHAKIIENTPARTVVQWRYPLVDVKHVIANYDPGTGWGDWGDWYFYIYPDGVAAKVARLWTDGSSYHEFQEGMVITGPDQHPEQVLEIDPALELTTIQGEVRRYSWADGPPSADYGGVRIHEVQYQGEYDPFTIAGGEKTSGGVYSGEVTDYSVFPSWNHWPVAQMPSDGRYASFPDRTAHSSLTHFSGNEESVWNSDTPYARQLFLEGMSRKGPEELIKLTKSWAQAPEIQALSGCEAFGYHQAKREYPLVATNRHMTVRVNAGEEHPIVNTCFVVRNWGHDGAAEVRIDGAESPDIRQGTFVDTDGTDTMVIWIQLEAVTPVAFSISGAEPDPDYTAPSALAERCDPKTWAAWREMRRLEEPIAVRAPVVHWDEPGWFDGDTVRRMKVDETLRAAKSMTWSAWVRTDASGTVMSLLPGRGTQWAKGSMILFLKDGDLVLDVGSVGEAKSEAAELRDDHWHHVAVTLVPRAVHFYIDGEHRHSGALIFDSAYPADQVAYMNVGHTGYRDIPHFTGGIRHAEVYDYAMTDGQIWNLYKDGSPVPDTDRVKNGSFELQTDRLMFWDVGSSASARDGADQNHGKCLTIMGPGTATRQTVPLEKNRVYTISLRYNASGLTRGSVVFDTGGRFDGPGQGRVVMDARSDGWVQYMGRFFSGDHTDVPLRIRPDEEAAGNVYVDDISVEALNAAPIIGSRPGTLMEQEHPYIYTLVAEDPDHDAVTYAGVTVPSWLHFYAASGELRGTPGQNDVGSHEVVLAVHAGEHVVEQRFTLVVNKLSEHAPRNLVLNGSFEFGGDTAIFWELGGSTSVARHTARQGNRCLQIAGPCAPIKKTIALEKDTDYTLSLWYNATELTAGTVVVDTDDRFDGPGQGQVVIGAGDNGWTHHAGTFNSGDHSSVTLRVFADGATTGKVYVDDIVLSAEGRHVD